MWLHPCTHSSRQFGGRPLQFEGDLVRNRATLIKFVYATLGSVDLGSVSLSNKQSCAQIFIVGDQRSRQWNPPKVQICNKHLQGIMRSVVLFLPSDIEIASFGVSSHGQSGAWLYHVAEILGRAPARVQTCHSMLNSHLFNSHVCRVVLSIIHAQAKVI